MGKIPEARYLNVDFEVEAEFDLSPLIEALKKEDVFFLFDQTSEHSSSFDIEAGLGFAETPEEHILELLDVLENLPVKLKELLLNSRKKVFDIGFECGRLNIHMDSCLSSETMQRIAQLSCGINIRLYPWHPYYEK